LPYIENNSNYCFSIWWFNCCIKYEH